MNNNLSIEIKEVDSKVFDELLNSSPDSSVKIDDLITSKEEDELEDKSKNEKEESLKEVDSEFFEKAFENEPEKDKKEIKQKTQEEVKTTENNSEEFTESDFFKTKAEILIEKGIWFDFEGREDYEFNEETYGELVEKQAEWKAEEKYNEKVEKLGNYKVLLDHLEEGGDPSEIIEIFNASKEANNIDTSTQKGKVEYMRNYYINELGWSETKFNRNIDSWSKTETLDDEFNDVKELYSELQKEKIEQKRIEHQEYLRQQDEIKKNFESNIEVTLNARKDLSKDEVKVLKEEILNYNEKLPDGRKVNKFTVNFMKMQSNLDDFIDLVRFVSNKKKFMKNIEENTELKTVKKNWDMIKKGGSLTSGSGGNYREKPKTGDLKIL